jgi:protein involved in polysaccharide export with SLBB domain
VFQRIVIFSLFFCFFSLANLPAQTTEEFRFQKADGLKLLIYDDYMEPQSNKLLANFHDVEYIIDGDGFLQLGAFGELYVEGLTVREVTELFREKFRKYAKDLTIIVTPMIRLVLVGEFGKSGMYRFSPNTSFWDVVAEAGGMSNSLVTENMYIMREGEIVYANFIESLSTGTSLNELGLKSGDELIAPRINRVSFNAIMRYVNFFASIILLYYAMSSKGNR